MCNRKVFGDQFILFEFFKIVGRNRWYTVVAYDTVNGTGIQDRTYVYRIGGAIIQSNIEMRGISASGDIFNGIAVPSELFAGALQAENCSV